MAYKKLLFALLLISIIIPFAPAEAVTKGSTAPPPSSNLQNISQAVTQSYNAVNGVQKGMIVRLKPNDSSTVEPLGGAKESQMLGVVVAANDSTVTLSPQKITQQQVFVATAGRFEVLVSNQNGAIHAGDFITISSIAGIGMLADQNQSIILGKATSSFDGKSNVQSTVSLKDSSGHSQQIAIGRMIVDISIAHNPLQSKTSDYVPSFLAKAAVTIASKPVSAARIYLAVITLFVAAAVTASMLYSGVRSGMLAIGRNPLSKKSIIRSLIQTVIAGLIIFVVGVLGVYLLLKL